MQTNTFDVIIVGAGISGIGSAYWVQKKCPGQTFCVLEAREAIGGTWSLFQYPGIRSDSDMFTFGFRFKPWTNPKSLSSGKVIQSYLQETIEENKLGPHIRFKHKMLDADWSDEKKRWTLRVDTPEGIIEMYARFISICTGYYDYKEAHRPAFKGEEDFKGTITIPQFWPKDLDYTDKKVVIVGSGATAVTMMPAMAENGAAHVTMLQRSPTYIVALPNRNGLFILLKKIFPLSWAYRVARWQNILVSMLSFGLSRRFPKRMRKVFMNGAAKQLPEGFPVEKHFGPRYNPWDQRLCVVPDGDFFRVIRRGQASVVTDTISHFTHNGIKVNSGEELEADIIVLATGLKIQLLGGATLSVNGIPAIPNDSLIYKGMMISDVPNLVYAFGYTNASWTLKVDLTANFLCRLINYMERNNYEVVIPVKEDLESEEPFVDLSSGYIQRAKEVLPKQGKRRPWRVYQSYLIDMMATRFGRLADKVLTFQR